VRDADVCYNGEIWSGEPREGRDFARMIHADFPNRCIIGNRSRQNRERQADMVVQVSLGFNNAVTDREDRRGELLGTGFSAASGDTDHS
jgi:hypothetical protein